MVNVWTVACKSQLVTRSDAEPTTDEDGQNTALVGVAIVVFVIVILALVATVTLWLRSRRHDRERSVAKLTFR